MPNKIMRAKPVIAKASDGEGSKASIRGGKPGIRLCAREFKVHFLKPFSKTETREPAAAQPKPQAVVVQPVQRQKSVRAVFKKTERSIESCAPQPEINAPWRSLQERQRDALPGTAEAKTQRRQAANLRRQKQKLDKQLYALTPEARSDYLAFFDRVGKGDPKTAERFNQSFRGCISLEQAVGKQAQKLTNDRWRDAGFACPWKASARLDVQLYLMTDLDAVRFMLPLKQDSLLAQNAFSHAQARTQEQGEAIFNLLKAGGNCVAQRQDLAGEFVRLPKEDRDAFLSAFEDIHTDNADLVGAIFGDKETTSLREGFIRYFNAKKFERLRSQNIVLKTVPAQKQSNAIEADTQAIAVAQLADKNSKIMSKGTKVDTLAIAVAPLVETRGVAGMVVSDNGTLSRKGLKHLANYQDKNALLAMRVKDGKTYFKAVSEIYCEIKETEACAGFLSRHWAIGKFISTDAEQVTVEMLKDALAQERKAGNRSVQVF